MVRSPQEVRNRGATRWARVIRARRIVMDSRLMLVVVMHAVAVVAINVGSSIARNHPPWIS